MQCIVYLKILVQYKLKSVYPYSSRMCCVKNEKIAIINQYKIKPRIHFWLVKEIEKENDMQASVGKFLKSQNVSRKQ